MSPGLALTIVVAGSYLAAHVAFEWIGKRFLIVSGAEYLVLGILLGPQVSNILNPGLIDGFAPITTLAIGWMGALLGTKLLLRRMVLVPGIAYRLAFVESFITLFVVAACEVFVLQYFFHFTLLEALAPAVAFGAIGVASSTVGVELIAQQNAGRGPLVTQLRTSAAMNAFVAVVIVGILMAGYQPDRGALFRPLTTTEWTVISIGVGVVGGWLFYLFLGDEKKVDRLFVSLAGAIILVSGIAAYLRLSPLLSTMFFGALLVNTSKQRAEITTALERVERPLYFVLLIFVGASWNPSGTIWIWPVAVFFIARIIGKIGGARIAARANGLLPVLGADWGRALIGQGGLALALALIYVYQDTLPLPNIVFTAAIVSVLLTDLSSGRLVQWVLDKERR